MKQQLAIVIAALMITSMAFAVSTSAVSAAHAPTVKITPTLTMAGVMDFEIKVTNTGGDPITSVEVDLPFVVDGWIGALKADTVAVSTSSIPETVLFAGTKIPITTGYGLTLAENTPVTIGEGDTIDIVSGITVIVPAGTVIGSSGEIPGGTAGTSVGATVTLPVIIEIDSNDDIKLAVDGGDPVEYTIAAGSYNLTGAELVTAINAVIAGSGATASWDEGHIVFTSSRLGSRSSVAVTAGTNDASGILGFSDPTETSGAAGTIVTLMYETRVTLNTATLVKPKVSAGGPVKLPAETQIELTAPVTSSLPNVTLASDTHAVTSAGIDDADLCAETEGKVGPNDITNANLIVKADCPLVADNEVTLLSTTEQIKLLKGTKVVLTGLELPIESEVELITDTSRNLWEASTVVLVDSADITISDTAEFGLPPDYEITATLDISQTVTLSKDTEVELPKDAGVTLPGRTQGTSVGADISGSLPVTITLDTNDDIKLTVDGDAAVEYTISPDTYDAATLAPAINTAITGSGATASWDTEASCIVFTSDSVGPTSSVVVTAGTNDARETLGFSSPVETAGDPGTMVAPPIPSNWKVASIITNTVTWESATAEDGIGPGKSLTFSIRAAAIEGEHLWIVRTTDADGDMEYKTLTTTVDGTAPTILEVTMEPEMVGEGPATIKVEADEVLSKLENVYYQIDENEDHIGDPANLIAMESADGITWTGTLTIPKDGLWDGSRVDIEILGVGYEDPAGNEGSDVSQTIHSTADPHINTIPPLLPANLKMTGEAPFENEVNQKSQLITGTAIDNIAGTPTAEEGMTVKISVNTTTYETTSLAGGAFAKEINLNEGSNTIQVWVIDELGNVGPENEQTVFLDSIKPAISMVSVADKSYEDNMPVKYNTPTVVLTIKDPGYPSTALGVETFTVVLQKADGENIATLENATPWDKATGRFENTIPEQLDNFYRIYVVATDLMGNSDSATFWFEVDTKAPTMPSLSATTNPVLDGTSVAEPKVQKKTALVFYGSGLEASSKAKIYLIDQATGSTISTETTEASAAGDFSKSLTLAEGKVIRIEVETIDAAGNVSLKSTYGYVMVDATAPLVTLAELPETTDKTSITISGTVSKDAWEDWSDITLTVQIGTGIVTVPCVGGSYEYSLSLAEGPNTIVVQATDDIGNVSSVAHATVERTVTPWAIYAIILVILALVLAAIAIFRKR